MRGALAFLTPVGGARTPTPADLRWFPFAGALIGAAVGGSWWLAGRWWPAGVAAAIAVAVDLALTGMLHIDGLVDSADGLLPHLSRERRLEVMAQPDVGAFGFAAGGTALLLRWTALAALRPSVVLIAAAWCLSRSIMAVVASAMPYARRDTGGLASAFIPEVGGTAALVAVVGGSMSMALAVWWRLVPGAVAVTAGAMAAALVCAFARRRLGGYTGDVLGAAGVVAETVALVVAAARW